MSDIEQDARELAAIAAVQTILKTREAAIKARISDTIRRGSVGVHVGDVELGTVIMPRPSRTIRVDIVDADLVLPWVVEDFGDHMVALQLTEQGRSSAVERAKAEHADAGSPDEYTALPGVRVTAETGPAPTPRFRRATGVDLAGEVRGMVTRGELTLTDLLGVEAAQ